jgi:uncharacterized membrane protein
MVEPLTKQAKQEIAQAIARAEAETSGEIRVHLKRRCGADTLSQAIKDFQKLGMHRTKDRSGVLIFIALESHAFAILGDRGIHEKVGTAFWNETRDIMEDYFKSGRLKEGILAGVESAGRKLRAFFPRQASDRDELSNTVTED